MSRVLGLGRDMVQSYYFGVGPVTFGASIGTVNPMVGTERQTETQWMANMGLRLFGGGLAPGRARFHPRARAVRTDRRPEGIAPATA